MMQGEYDVVVARSAKTDVANKKRYILEKFRYREYAESFSSRIKTAVQSLDTFPAGFIDSGFSYRGYDIYLKPISDHLLFYTVDEELKIVTVLRILQDGMDWQNIIKIWLEQSE